MENLFQQWAQEPCIKKTVISANGSNRIYHRMQSDNHRCIAAYNPDVRENEAFFYFAQQMRDHGIRVPEIYAISADRTRYLQQDLGDTTIYSYITSKRANFMDVDDDIRRLFQSALDDLILIQTRIRNADFHYAYPRPRFDRQSLQWDLNYFKYYFLKMGNIPFDEQRLEDDYNLFIDYLLDEDCSYFLYRDFQARNIMIGPDKELYYIDFQGARQGAAQYDVASLLYSAKSDVPQPIRKELLDYYIDHLSQLIDIDQKSFRHKFYGYVLARIMQAMGAYGFRGFYEKKDYFLRSIPLAVSNLRYIIRNIELPIHIPELSQVWEKIAYNDYYQDKDDRLNIRIFSFSYKKGIPPDKSGNGGGFVFDCRALPNPGRYEEYKQLTGMDQPVIDFLKEKPEIAAFLDHTKALVSQSIEDYQSRGFQNLMVNFGCTGGQHRSVYCAEQMAEYVRKHYDCRVVLRHIEQQK